jgi:hypothetical protein
MHGERERVTLFGDVDRAPDAVSVDELDLDREWQVVQVWLELRDL